MKRTVLFFLFFIFSFASRSQADKDSCTLQISLLTCAPGTELYSIFGHTAIRVLDTQRGMDIVYNYGTFDDSDPLFYVHFMRGIMIYSLSAETFNNFMQEYTYEHRDVIAQTLNLTCTEKQRLYDSLRNNTLDNNRFYDYHFHTDNCTTRAAVIIENNTNDSFFFPDILPGTPPTFRQMIHEYLDKQNAYWSEFGIDLFLGRNLDSFANNTTARHFLPDYLYRGFEKAYSGKRFLVGGNQTLLSFPEEKIRAPWFTPRFLFTAILILVIVSLFFTNKPAVSATLFIFDIVFFSLVGLTGILMASMWLGRVDNVCSNNMNILWALPTHIVAVFFIRKKAAWIKYYFLATAIIATVLLAGFPWWVQRMNTAVLPLLGIIIFRSFILFQNRNYAEKSYLQRSVPGV